MFVNVTSSTHHVVVIPFLDVTLTDSNILSAVDTITKWDEFGYRLRVPTFKRNKIRSQYQTDLERKKAIIEEFVLHHPAPNWKEIALALYRMKHHDLLENIYDKKFLIGNLCLRGATTPIYVSKSYSKQTSTLSRRKRDVHLLAKKNTPNPRFESASL